jgi:hypothetical protein
MAKSLVEEPGTHTQAADVGRMLDRLEAYIASGSRERMNEEALLVLLSSQLKLIQALYILSNVSSLTSQSCRAYLLSVVQVVDNCFPRLHDLSILKLQHVIFDQEAGNLLAL